MHVNGSRISLRQADLNHRKTASTKSPESPKSLLKVFWCASESLRCDPGIDSKFVGFGGQALWALEAAT